MCGIHNEGEQKSTGSIAWVEVDCRDCRRNVAIESQSGYLFGGTVVANILWGNPEKTAEELQKILELVCL